MLENILVGLTLVVAGYFTVRGIIASLSGKPKCCGGCGKCPFALNGKCDTLVSIEKQKPSSCSKHPEEK